MIRGRHRLNDNSCFLGYVKIEVVSFSFVWHFDWKINQNDDDARLSWSKRISHIEIWSHELQSSNQKLELVRFQLFSLRPVSLGPEVCLGKIWTIFNLFRSDFLISLRREIFFSCRRLHLDQDLFVAQAFTREESPFVHDFTSALLICTYIQTNTSWWSCLVDVQTNFSSFNWRHQARQQEPKDYDISKGDVRDLCKPTYHRIGNVTDGVRFFSRTMHLQLENLIFFPMIVRTEPFYHARVKKVQS